MPIRQSRGSTRKRAGSRCSCSSPTSWCSGPRLRSRVKRTASGMGRSRPSTATPPPPGTRGPTATAWVRASASHSTVRSAPIPWTSRAAASTPATTGRTAGSKGSAWICSTPSGMPSSAARWMRRTGWSSTVPHRTGGVLPGPLHHAGGLSGGHVQRPRHRGDRLLHGRQAHPIVPCPRGASLPEPKGADCRTTPDGKLRVFPSIDGKSVLFSSNRTGTVQIYRASLDGESLLYLTDGDSPNYDPRRSWRRRRDRGGVRTVGITRFAGSNGLPPYRRKDQHRTAIRQSTRRSGPYGIVADHATDGRLRGPDKASYRKHPSAPHPFRPEAYDLPAPRCF